MSKAPVRAKVAPQPLDVSALEQMVEPLTVQIQRIKNGHYSPIPLPVGESGQPGVGWTRSEVLAIDQGWLVNHWSGGGMYQITITDSTMPTPQRLVWTPWWDPAVFPEKIPPTMADGVRPGLVVPAAPVSAPVAVGVAAPQAPQGPIMTQFPNGLPSGGLLPAAPIPAAVPATPFFQPPIYSSRAYGTDPMATQIAMQAEADRRRLEERVAAAEAQLRQAQLETLQRQHETERERERAQTQQMIGRLESRITELTQQQTTARPNGELEMLKAQLENERREREAERRERETRELVERMNQQVQLQIQQLQQSFQQMQQLAANKGPDPMLQLLMEQNRNSMDAMKEIARQGSDQLGKMQAFMMSPRDVLQMTKEASSGIDTVTQKMTGMFGGVLDMQQRVIENAMQLNQGGSETVALIRDGVSALQSMGERYMISKTKESQVVQQAQSAAAQAQAQAAAITAQAQVAIARAQQPQIVPAPSPRPAPAPAPRAGLGGPPPPSSFEEFKKRREAEEKAILEAQQPRETAEPAKVEIVKADEAPRATRSDEEWFGPLLPTVLQVRQAVDEFVQMLVQNKQPPFDAATPKNVAMGIVQAVGVCEQNNLPVPAMVELLMPGKLDEFMAILLPNVSTDFHADVIKELRIATGDDDEDDEDDDGGDGFDDGEQHDDVRDGAAG